VPLREAVTPARAKRINGHGFGFGLAVWSVDDPAQAWALWGLGVDCVISRPPEGVVAAWRRK